MAPATPVIQLIRLNAPRASLPKFVNQFRRTFALGNQSQLSSSSPLPSSPASLHCRTLSTGASIHTGAPTSAAKWLGRNNNSSSSRAYSNSSEYRLFPVWYQLSLIDYSTLANKITLHRRATSGRIGLGSCATALQALSTNISGCGQQCRTRAQKARGG